MQLPGMLNFYNMALDQGNIAHFELEPCDTHSQNGAVKRNFFVKNAETYSMFNVWHSPL